MRNELLRRLYEALLREQALKDGPLQIDEGYRVPGEVPRGLILPILAPNVDIYGTHRFHRQEKKWHQVYTGTPSIDAVQSNQVPPSEVWYIFAASCWHNDPLSRELRMEIRAPIGFSYNYLLGVPSTSDCDSAIAATATAFGPNVQLPLLRPFYLPGGYQLQARVNSIAAGQTVSLATHFLRLRAGEYVASP